MKILHTSDWHLGRSLYGRRRYDEFESFLDWLLITINEQKIDALLVAGDIFDTTTPSNKAQQLYYAFLAKVANSHCRHVVVIGGNHDSPSFLNAPKALLKALNVYVVGAMAENLDDEVILLHKKDSKEVEAIICAVPYLRDKDLRSVAAGETLDDKNRKLSEGLKNHYAQVVALAVEKRAALPKSEAGLVPIIGMGHLFAAGAKTQEGDGVRELYIGSLAHIGKDAFPQAIDYLALGHLHVPQKVGGAEHIRYSGSPIPMGFGEAKQQKQVLMVSFHTATAAASTAPNIEIIPVPCFQTLVRLEGSLTLILSQLSQLKIEQSTAWLEIELTSQEVVADLREQIETAIQGSTMEVRRIKNKQVIDQVLRSVAVGESLDNLTVEQVFLRRLASRELTKADQQALTASFAEIVRDIHETDSHAE
ncbi:MAG TPA: exonuclease SbcCD subunit D C-terminal domain-containing protein [Marinospirillum sp.]|uniref:exonuclease SbcCD subunit D C-terminal domain-containing protein n=1 Tax=Marinospirillum sp. TaxID=2183934 RepID=UPI002B480716|nr:exonuclease SbcCD subunit D C-terminal domain-containing protein [Marinospirillum sp.]HKM14296.1 exonuclease SbcCD subunit D C-terminal domain-containing protein [Marinospirillum sp.]